MKRLTTFFLTVALFTICEWALTDYTSPLSAAMWTDYTCDYLAVEDDYGNDNDYAIDDVVTVDDVEYTIVGENLFVNGGFGNEVEDWTGSDYETAADPDDFTISEEGGYNEGEYLTIASNSTGGGQGPNANTSVNNLTQSIQIESGKTYLFVGYTTGGSSTGGGGGPNQNTTSSGLNQMSDATTEVTQTSSSGGGGPGGGQTTTTAVAYVTLQWGTTNPGPQTSTTWTQTLAVFTAETDYAGMHLAQSGSYDGFQLYEVEAAEVEPTPDPNPEPDPDPDPEGTVDLVAHSETAEFDHWSTTGNNGTLQYNTWSTESDASGMVTPFIENWVNASSGTLTAATLSHKTLVGLPAGDYDVSLDIRILNETGNSVGTGTTFNANDQSVDLVEAGTTGSYNGTPEVYGTYTVACEVDDSGLLDISITIPDNATYNWIAFKNLAVTTQADTEDMPVIVPIDGAMSAEAKAAMEEAVGTYNDDPTAAHFTAAIEAIQDAQVSIEEYAEIAALVNALDEDGRAAWDKTTSGVAFNAGTLSSSADYTDDMATAQKAQTTEGSDMTFVVLYDGDWIGQTGTYSTGVEIYGGNSTDFPVGKVLYKQIEDMQPGNYTVTFYAVASAAQWDAGGVTYGSGIAQVFVNDVAEDVDIISQLACTPSDYEYTMTGTVGSDGILQFGLQNIAQGGNWYVGQAISMTLGGVVTEVEVKGNYEFINEQWVSLDLGRVAQSDISYQLNDNTITVNAGTGQNDVALGNSESYTDAGPFTTEEFSVGISQNWFIVVGTDLSAKEGNSYLWWMNGDNKNTDVPPTMIVGLEDGEILFAWDLSESGLDDNMQSRLNYLNGWTGFGLTSTTGTSVISDICFYTWDDAVTTYPELVTGGVDLAVSSVQATVESGAVFDLSGRKVSKTLKGVYIIDGKKVLVK